MAEESDYDMWVLCSKKLGEANKQLASKEQELTDSRKQWKNLAGKCDRLSEANCDLRDMLDDKDKRIKEISNALLVLNADRKKARKAWKEVVRRGYHGGSVWCEAMCDALGVD